MLRVQGIVFKGGVRLMVVCRKSFTFYDLPQRIQVELRSVWTHYMQGIEYLEAFLPKDCPASKVQQAFTVAAGSRGRDMYEAANKHNLAVVAGSAQDVGIIGHFSSGGKSRAPCDATIDLVNNTRVGHGPLSATYGLSVDNVLEIRVVTPDGQLRVANPCVNPDLFWALRGGGGGTFGVVTFVTMKAYPSPQSTRHSFSLSLANSINQTLFWTLVAEIIADFPRLKEGGMEGYSTIVPPAAIPGAKSWLYSWGMNIFNKPKGTAETLFDPIMRKLDPLNGTDIIYQQSVDYYPDFFTLWNSTITDEKVATGGATLGSRLIPAKGLADKQRLSTVLQWLAAPPQGQSVAGQVLQP